MATLHTVKKNEHLLTQYLDVVWPDVTFSGNSHIKLILEILKEKN